MKHDLVHELRLTVFPVALGAGERLFGETSDKRLLRLIDTKTIESGLARLTYERAREAYTNLPGRTRPDRGPGGEAPSLLPLRCLRQRNVTRVR
jgi:hypothetical protein